MKKLLGFFLLIVGALVCVNACTDLDTTTIGNIGTWRISGAALLAFAMALMVSGKS